VGQHEHEVLQRGSPADENGTEHESYAVFSSATTWQAQYSRSARQHLKAAVELGSIYSVRVAAAGELEWEQFGGPAVFFLTNKASLAFFSDGDTPNRTLCSHARRAPRPGQGDGEQ
jgi:hypothetical protein